MANVWIVGLYDGARDNQPHYFGPFASHPDGPDRRYT